MVVKLTEYKMKHPQLSYSGILKDKFFATSIKKEKLIKMKNMKILTSTFSTLECDSYLFFFISY